MAEARNEEQGAGRPKCATCVHFFRENPQAGHCRRHPPTPFHMPQKTAMGAIQMLLQSSWPPVTPERWCGEHPDFLRWLSENRNRALDLMEFEAAPAKGAA